MVKSCLSRLRKEINFLKEIGCEAFVCVSYHGPEDYRRHMEKISTSSRTESFVNKLDLEEKYYIHIEGMMYIYSTPITRALVE